MPRVRDVPSTVGLFGAIKALSGAIPEKSSWDADIECIKYQADKGEWKTIVYIKATEDVDGFLNSVKPLLTSKKDVNEFAYALTLLIDDEKNFMINTHFPFHDEKDIPYQVFLASQPFSLQVKKMTELKNTLMKNYDAAQPDRNAKKLILKMQVIALTKDKHPPPISEEDYKLIKGKYLLGEDAGKLVATADELAESITDFIWYKYWKNYHSVDFYTSAIKVMEYLIQNYRGKSRLSSSDVEQCKSSSEIGKAFLLGFAILKEFDFVSKDYRFMPLHNLIPGVKRLQRITESRFEEGEKTTTIKQICNLMYGHFRGVRKETHFYPIVLAAKILEFHHIIEIECKSISPWDVVEAKIHYRGATAEALYEKIKGELDEAFTPLLKAYIHVKNKNRLKEPFSDLVRIHKNVKDAYEQIEEIGLDELRKKVDEGIKSIGETCKKILEVKKAAVRRELFITPEMEESIEQKLGKGSLLQDLPARFSAEKDLRDRANDFVTIITEIKKTAEEFEDAEYYLFARSLYNACIEWADNVGKMLKWADVYDYFKLLAKIAEAVKIQRNEETILVTELEPIISTSIKEPIWQTFFEGFVKHYEQLITFEKDEPVNIIRKEVDELEDTVVGGVVSEKISKYQQIDEVVNGVFEKITNFSPKELVIVFPTEIDKKSRILVGDIEAFEQTFNNRRTEANRWIRIMDKLLEAFPEESRKHFREEIRLNAYSIKRLSLPSTYDDQEAWVDVAGEFANCYYNLKTVRTEIMENIEAVVKALFPHGTPIEGLKSLEEISKALKELVEIKEKHPEVSTLRDLCEALDVKSIFNLWKDKEKLNLFLLWLLFAVKGIPLL